jgi:glycyl-tRNA synthetase beta chain
MQAMFGILSNIYRGEELGKIASIAPALGQLSDRGLADAVIKDVFPKVDVLSDPTAVLPVEQRDRKNAATLIEVVAFIFDRLKVQQKEAGVRHDLIDAVFALGGEDDLVRLLARVKALQSFVATDDGANLLAGYKRAANILKKEGVDQSVMPAKAGISGGASEAETPASAGVTPLTYTPEPAEADLIAALDAAEPRASAAVQAEDFEGAMGALASLRAPIDAFFDKVIVNDSDPDKRLARLALLARVRDAVHAVADFSKIAG